MPRLASILGVLLLGVGCFAGDPGPLIDARQTVDGGASGDGGMCLGTLPFLSECTENAQCAESCLCFPFMAKGPHCTHACDGPEDCPAPSTGCSGNGVCKVP